MFTVEPVSKDADMYRVIPLYTDSPVPERERIRREHAEWSDATFGGVGPVGPLKHLSKEALEAAADPSEPLEWADMQFLLWDAQRRAGISDGEITAAMIEKLEINKSRQWPEPKDGEPRLHIKEQPAPVVPEEMPMPNALSMYAVDAVAAIAEVRGWNACRAALHQAEPVTTANKLGNSQVHSDCCQEQSPIDHGYRPECECSGCKATARICAELTGNSPVIPEDLHRATMLQANQRDLSQPVDPQVAEYEKIMLQAGWVMVPKTVTPEISLAINKVGQHCTCGNCSQRLWDMLLAAAPKQEGNNG
ncbi:TPA: DUF550 domain-containing protein [Salmonella enterica]